MQKKIGDRLKEARKYFDLTQEKFAEMLNITSVSVGNYESNRRALPEEVFNILAQKGININWLLSGRGGMLSSNHIDHGTIGAGLEALKQLFDIREKEWDILNLIRASNLTDEELKELSDIIKQSIQSIQADNK